MLVVEHISGGYGASTVVNDASLVVESGEVVGLLGPNGHGKTTLMRLLSGLLTPRSGRVELEGIDLAGSRAHTIARSGLTQVPQGDLLFGDMTVLENLYMGAFDADRWRRREEHAERVFGVFPRLADRRGNLARTLSGGERRMLALGRGLMGRTSVLIVDEPALGLSPLMTEVIYNALAALRSEDIGILVVEETPSRLAGIADRLYVLDGGRIVADGPAKQILGDHSLLTTYLGLSTEREPA